MGKKYHASRAGRASRNPMTPVTLNKPNVVSSPNLTPPPQPQINAATTTAATVVNNPAPGSDSAEKTRREVVEALPTLQARVTGAPPVDNFVRHRSVTTDLGWPGPWLGCVTQRTIIHQGV